MLLPPRLQYVDSVFVLYEHGYLDSMLDEVGECRVRGSVYEPWRREGERGGGGALKLKVYITFPKVLDLVSRTRLEDSQLPVTPAGSKGTFTFAQIHIYINNNKY